MTMTEEQFDQMYTAVENHITTDASWNGTMFETYGRELEFVYKQPDTNVWTWIEGDGDDTFLVSGRLRVNRLGYLITEQPVPPNTFIEVRIEP